MIREDVPGIVIEPGSSTTRLGMSGDMSPTCVVPSAVLRAEGCNPYYIPMCEAPLGSAEVLTPVIDGVVHDFDGVAGLWTYLSDTQLGLRFDEQPLTVTEELWVPGHIRQRMLETAFETLQVPLFQLVKAPLAATFESARPSALVVSVGSGVASATPVVDGIVRSKAAMHTRFAGDFLDVHLLMQLEHTDNIVPQYQVTKRQHGLKQNEAVHNNEQYQLKPRASDSFHKYQLSRLLTEFKRVCCVASTTPLRGPEIKGTQPYEFPTGFNLLLGAERHVAVESLFQPTMTALPDGSTPEINSLGLSELIYQTLQKVDAPPEVVMSLISNIVLHGGTSHIPGMTQRLTNEISGLMPNLQSRIVQRPNHPVWTGASVLASLNEFDESTWITKQQYNELGAQHLLEKQD